MTKTQALLFASFFLYSCGEPKPNPTPAPVTPTPSATPNTPNTPPAEPYDPFKSGFCEVTIDGGAPTKTPGGLMNISSAHWPTGDMKKPSWPLLINCGKVNLSATMSSTPENFPMKTGKIPIAAKDEKPGEIVATSPANAAGELNIEAWDMSGIKGTFELTSKNFETKTDTLYKGTFDFKCPYALQMGEPCK